GDRFCQTNSRGGKMTFITQVHPGPKPLCFLLLSSLFALVAQAATVRGTVNDALGAVIPRARVELTANNQPVASVTADDEGKYEFQDVSAGRYQVRASAPSFELTSSNPFYVGEGAIANVDLLLAIGVVS